MRRLFSVRVLAVTGTIVCVLVVVLWLGTLPFVWLYTGHWRHHAMQLGMQHGRIAVTVWRFHAPQPAEIRKIADARWPDVELLGDSFGVTVNTGAFGSRQTPTRFCEVRLPMWMPLLAVAAPTGLAMVVLRRRQMAQRRGLCPVCGYDVRHCVDRCSECGAALTGKA